MTAIVDVVLLRMVAESLAKLAQEREHRAGVAAVVGSEDSADYLRGHAEGLRYAADALTELLDPAPHLQVVE